MGLGAQAVTCCGMRSGFSTDATHILIVRHGEGRGRIRSYLQDALDDITRRRPELAARLRVVSTGGSPPDLTQTRAVVFWLADPLREMYPPCYEEAAGIAAEGMARGIRIVNGPDALSNTIKSTQARIWRAAGIRTPEHREFVDRPGFERALGLTRFPAVLRADRYHSQKGMRVLATSHEALTLPKIAIEYPGAIAEFVDVRAGFRDSGSADVWSELYHKKRQFVFGAEVQTGHLFFSTMPLVSSDNCTFKVPGHSPGRWTRATSRITRRPPLHRVEARWKADLRGDRRRRHERQLWDQALAEDLQYWESGSEHPDLMIAAMWALGLEFGAIDYSSLADGSLVLWEANPHFSLPPVRGTMFAAERRTRVRFARHYDGIAMFFSSLLDGVGPAAF
jgi:hypothetical protein